MNDTDVLQNLCNQGGWNLLEDRPYLLDQGRAIAVRKPTILQGQASTEIVTGANYTREMFSTEASKTFLSVRDLKMKNMGGMFCILSYGELDVERCRMEGPNPIHCPAGSLACRDTQFKFGRLDGHSHDHDIYLYPCTSFLVDNCRFDPIPPSDKGDIVMGFGVHVDGPIADCERASIGNSMFTCYRGILTHPKRRTIVEGCQLPGSQIEVRKGGALVVGCGVDHWRVFECQWEQGGKIEMIGCENVSV